MKYYVLANLMVFSIPVFACPNLAGVYECRNADGSKPHDKEIIKFSQRVESGISIYTFDRISKKGTEVRADNKTYRWIVDESLRDGKKKAACLSSNKLKVRLTGKLYNDGEYFSDMDSSFTWIKKANGRIEEFGTIIMFVGEDQLRADSHKICRPI